MGKETLGELEELVLLAALRLREEAYGLSIADEIEEAGGRPTARASVYVTLRRLEKEGLISTNRERLLPGESGTPRRLVRVEPKGIALLRASIRTREQLSKGLDDILGAHS